MVLVRNIMLLTKVNLTSDAMLQSKRKLPLHDTRKQHFARTLLDSLRQYDVLKQHVHREQHDCLKQIRCFQATRCFQAALSQANIVFLSTKMHFEQHYCLDIMLSSNKMLSSNIIVWSKIWCSQTALCPKGTWFSQDHIAGKNTALGATILCYCGIFS